MSLITKQDGSAQIVQYDLDSAASVNLTTRLPAQRWGQRNKATWQKTQRQTLPDHGVKKCCFTQPVILPKAAAAVEPSLHQPQRFCGGQALGEPFFRRYHYYKKYGSTGQGARSADQHNFPTGSMPQPKSIHSAYQS